MRTILPKAVGIAPPSTSTSSALPKRSRPSSGRKVKPDKCSECVKHKKKCEFLYGSSSCHQCTVKQKECHKRSLTDSQRERVRESPKRRRLDSSPTNDEEPEREALSPVLAPGVLPQMSSATSPSKEFSGDIHGFEQSLEFLSPTPSSTSNENSFELQVQQLEDQLLRNLGSRDTAVRLMELLQSRLGVDQLVDFWKEIVLKTVRGRSQGVDMLSEAFKRKGESEEAVGFWKVLVQRHPDKVKYAEQLTNAFTSMGNVAGAIEFWEQVIETPPSSNSQRDVERLDMARSELAKCEVDGEPSVCSERVNAIQTRRFLWRCSRSIGKAMSQATRVQKAIQVYQSLGSGGRRRGFMSGFCEGVIGSHDRKAVVNSIKALPGNEFTNEVLCLVHSDVGDQPEVETVQFWREQWMRNRADISNLLNFARALERNNELDEAINLCTSSNDWLVKAELRRLLILQAGALQRNGDLDAAINLCKGCDDSRVKDELSRLLRVIGRDAEFEYWNPLVGRTGLPESAVECLTYTYLFLNDNYAIVELCHSQLSNFRLNYDLCSAVQRTVTKDGDWNRAVRIWDILKAKHPHWHQSDVGPSLIEALLQSTQIDRAHEVCDLLPNFGLNNSRKMTDSLIATRGISSALKFWEKRILSSFASIVDFLVDEVQRIMEMRSDSHEDLRFWKRLYFLTFESRHILIHPLTRAFAMDYEGLIEFWRDRCRSGDVIFRDLQCLYSLQDAIESKRDAGFERRFWTTLFLCNPDNEKVTNVLVTALRRSNPEIALESYKYLLTRSRTAYTFTQEVDRVFKNLKKGDIQGEVEFWKTVVWERPGIEGFRNRLMRLFKRSGDVDQAVKFWTEMLSHVELVGWQRRLQKKLSEAKKWKKEVEAALTFRGLASGE